MQEEWFDSVVIGAGAAGLMCAASAGKRSRKVLILDHANKVGKKILMSGGGRCNFTNLYVEPSHYISSNPHFCKSALKRYTQYDFLDLVNSYDLAYHDKGEGQLFCDNKSIDILNILLQECDKFSVDIRTKTQIKGVQKTKDDKFYIQTNHTNYYCDSLVIATGGLSIPTMGASDFGFKIAKQFGHKIKPTEASLVPFTLTSKWLNLAQELSGLSMNVTVESNNQQFNDALLFTHRGLSGPAILQISNYWHYSEPVNINFLPEQSIVVLIEQWKENKEHASLKNLISRYLPKRFVTSWINSIDPSLSDKTMAQLSKSEIEKIDNLFCSWEIIPSGTEGYRTAEVTRGGVDTDRVSSKTFESKLTPKLYFVGEVLDVTGWLGGFNFQWAWASAWCAGQYI